MARKASLLARAINRLFAEPHYLSGWLALNQQHFTLSKDGVEWLSNPVRVLANLYRYLNMDARGEIPALYAIWDHDDELLQEALEFYDSLEAELGISDWQLLCKALKGKKGKDILGARLADIQAAHDGFQLGFDILSILPYVGKRTGFFNLKVTAGLGIIIPERLQNRDTQDAAFKVLSPPPAISGNEITAPTGGMYYAREAPDRPAFIEVGQHFEAGDPLFITEVMKMFNKVHAPFAGTVDEVLLDTDALIIKKGQPIFKVTPDEEIIVESLEEKNAAIRSQTDDFLSYTGFK
jgi:biotin carboxyl carrier protein